MSLTFIVVHVRIASSHVVVVVGAVPSITIPVSVFGSVGRKPRSVSVVTVTIVTVGVRSLIMRVLTEAVSSACFLIEVSVVLGIVSVRTHATIVIAVHVHVVHVAVHAIVVHVHAIEVRTVIAIAAILTSFLLFFRLALRRKGTAQIFIATGMTSRIVTVRPGRTVGTVQILVPIHAVSHIVSHILTVTRGDKQGGFGRT
mmetsp:Transcript_1245/g.1725  ORF Transcript_1245/g.1725 Transcript_1245/m.1725 type:complete len:200 (-) Transcript_1245:193-792(-)